MSDGNAILIVENLNKQFGSLTALRSTTFSVDPEECLTVFGQNGAGKTTLLKILATLIRSYSGTVTVFGTDLRSADDKLRRRIGFVSHETFLYSDLTVLDNLLFYARLYRLDRRAERAEQIIQDVGLEAKRHTVVRALSRGMKQRLSLGRAFLHEPKLLLLDEPFSGLDERAAEMLYFRLNAFRENGGSIVMATHDAERGWQQADRIAVLAKGGVAYESSVGDTTFESFHETYRGILSD